jgi:hypothetical protein
MAIARKKVIPRSGRGRTVKTAKKAVKKAVKKAAKKVEKTAKTVTQKVRKKVIAVGTDRRKSTAKKTTTRRPTAKSVAVARSAAAKKGWETRKANEQREAELHAKRVEAGKKGYAKRLLAKYQDARRADSLVLDTRKEALPILQERLDRQQKALERQLASKRKELRQKFAKMGREELLSYKHPDDWEDARSLSLQDLRTEIYGREVSKSLEILKGGHQRSQQILAATIQKVRHSPLQSKKTIEDWTTETLEAMVKAAGWEVVKSKNELLRDELRAYEFTSLEYEMFTQIAKRENMTTRDLYRILNGYL